MANPAPTINQINAFNATQGTTIDFNIIGGTELVRSNRIYIYDLSDNSLICTHLYVSTESIHELPPNTDGSIVYESGKSSADFVNGAQYYAQIQTFTDIAGTEGGSGLSVAKMFWCLVDPTLTITTIPSTISTTSYNVSATYNANTSVVSNIIQQYQFSLYSATGSLLQSSWVVVGNGEQQGTSTAYDISYNFTGLSVGSSYYVTVEVTTTQGMSVTTQSNTFTVSIDTPTLGEATVVNNACDGYISVTSNLSGEYGGSGSGEIVSFETDSENVFTKLQVDLDPIQDLHGYDAPWVGGAGKNKFYFSAIQQSNPRGLTYTRTEDEITISGTTTGTSDAYFWDAMDGYDGLYLPNGTYTITATGLTGSMKLIFSGAGRNGVQYSELLPSYPSKTVTVTDGTQPFSYFVIRTTTTGEVVNAKIKLQIESGSATTSWTPYENICPISGHDEVEVSVVGKNWLPNIKYQEASTRVQVGSDGDYSIVLPAGTYKLSYSAVTGATPYWQKQGGTTQNFNNNMVLTEKTAVNIWFYKSGSLSVSDIDWFQLELGTTATTYEPYNGQSYHQDIEATYTPTVQENDVYLFKQTGDVGGDRESIELVGGTVAWNQQVYDGNFTDASGWTGLSGGVFSVNNNECTVTVTANFMGVQTNVTNVEPSKRPTCISGHKYLISADLKASNNRNNSVGFGISHYASTHQIRKTFSVGTSYANYSFIGTQTTGTLAQTDGRFMLYDTAGGGSNCTLYAKNVYAINLTQMFGTTIADYIYSLEQATAGAGVAFFRKLFPKPYYAYNAGELMSVNTSAHNTVGFNAWDEEWEQGGINQTTGANTSNSNAIRSKNYIRVVPNATYYVKAPIAVRGYWYDADKNYINTESLGVNTTFTVPSGACYLRFIVGNSTTPITTYGNNICINLSWDGERDGEYEAYVKHSYPLDSSLTLRGIPKLDASNNLYYDGDTYESDGTVTRKYGIVDLGSLTWNYASDTTYPRFTVQLSGIKNGVSSVVSNIICSKYKATYTNDIYSNGTDKSIGVNSTYLWVRDTAYTDAATFKTAMSGVYLVYELATPTTETADAFEEIQKVTPIYGTEEFVDNRTVPMPVYTKTQYFTRDVYGGYIDLVSGVLVLKWKYASLSNTWTLNSSAGGIIYFQNSSYQDIINLDTNHDTETRVACDGIKCGSGYQALRGGTYPFTMGVISNKRLYIGVPITDFPDSTAFNRFIENANLHICYELATPLTFQLTPQQIQTLVGQNNVWSEQGEISLAYHIPITNLLVKRQDVDDVSGSWLTLYSQPITQSSDMDFTFIDFTNQYDKTYKYALVPLLTQTQSGVEVEVEGGYTVSDEVQSVFDGVFIVDSTGSQKCKANVGYGNVDMNQTVGTITPIGAKYPVVITNSKNQYHNGSISGTIVPDDYYFNGNLSRIDMVNKRDELEQFLTNKRAKIIKDWNGKIWLVMIMDNVSCTFNNNYGMGIVNFSTNWVEVGDPTNQQDLQETGLIDVGGV